MHDQCLCQQTLQKPVRLELTDGVAIIRGANSVVEPAEQKSTNVNDRACWAEYKNETKKVWVVVSVKCHQIQIWILATHPMAAMISDSPEILDRRCPKE